MPKRKAKRTQIVIVGQGRRFASKPAFLAVDFFCGAGGTTRGMIDAGGYVIAGVDKDEKCQQTYVENNPNQFADYSTPCFLTYDIFRKTRDYPNGQQMEIFTELETLVPFYRSRNKGVPLLFAICAPCQPFTSLSRKKLSARRKRDRKRDVNLLREAAKFVKRFSPELVLSENVAGIKAPRYGGVWDDFRKQLERLGYVIGTKIVCASRFGIAQYRKRSILIAVRKDLISKDRLAGLIREELLVPEADPDAVLLTVRDVIGHLPSIKAGETHRKIPNHRARQLSDTNLKRIATARPGESNAYMRKTKYGDLSLKCHRKVNRRMGERCFGDVYTRLRPDRPSATITTKCHSISNGRFGHYDTKQLRGISLREAAMIQSFPETYVFYPKDQIEPIARMIGNAVPPRLAEFFARYLVNSATLPSRGA
jgi:DNA (cytosine-5)-methyltransferase 1